MSSHWRFYASSQGHVPARELIPRLTRQERAELLELMRSVALMAPRQLPPLADARFPRLRLLAVPGRCLRLIFTVEGPSRQVLLALDGNRSGDRQVKHLGLAQWRLDDWRRRGTEMQRSQSLGGLGD